MDNKGQSILVIESGVYSHSLALYSFLKEMVDQGFNVDICNSQQSKSQIEKIKANLIVYPEELDLLINGMTQNVEELILTKKLDFTLCLNTYKFLFKVFSSYTTLLLPFCEENLNKDKYNLIIADSFALFWAIPLQKILNIPMIVSNSSIAFNFEMLGRPEEDEDSLKMVKDFNSQFNTDFKHIYDELIPNFPQILYHPLEFQPNSNKIEGKIWYVGRNQDTVFCKDKKQTKRIYLSFGTIYNKNTPLYKTFLKIFSKIQDYEFLISTGKNKELLNELALINTYDHIKLTEWVNQREVLNDSTLFITHAGMNSIKEGILSGTPMICLPQGVDQFVNGQRIEETKMGLQIKNVADEEQIEKAIHQILNNYEVYRSNVVKFQEYFEKSMSSSDMVKEIEKLLCQDQNDI